MARSDAPAPVLTLVPVERAVVYVTAGRVSTWILCWSGMLMGAFVANATSLRAAHFTALAGLPGWPETWGITLIVAGALSLIGRTIGRLAGDVLAAAGMAAMCAWYILFASSLIPGSAQYGFVPYLALGALHGVFAWLVYRTNGFRPALAVKT